MDLDRVILRKSREIQISKLKELRDEAEKMQEDQAKCDEVETQLKQVGSKFISGADWLQRYTLHFGAI